MTSTLKCSCLVWLFALGFSGAAQAAPDVSLEVTHQSISLGADGVRRSSEFSERVYRRGDTVWIERVLPAGAHREIEHAKAKAGAAIEHKHADLSSATRWIQHGAGNKLKLRLVSAHDKVVVDVDPTEYATVGFDGSWEAAYHLIDPAVLKRLRPIEKTSEGQWYESPKASGSNLVRVLWDTQRELPLKVSTRSADGSSSSTTTVKLLNSAIKQPWNSAAKFSIKDYSDFLD
jgi:hypothetical protein